MGNKVKIAAWGMNSPFLSGKTQTEVLDIALGKLDAVAGYRPDLVCLPEVFPVCGGDRDNPNWEAVSRLASEAISEKARKMRCHIVYSVYERSVAHPSLRYNVAKMTDRDGKLLGRYAKKHPVYEECTVNGVIPGRELPVVETDFGKVGMQICFDIGWRDEWAELGRKGAQLVLWLAAYDGGNLLNTYAAENMYYVASSVWTGHARVIDRMGRDLASGSHWNGLAMETIDLSTELYHTDRQADRIGKLRSALGEKVTIRGYSQENTFSVQSNCDAWPIERIEKEFGLTSYRAYHAVAEARQNRVRAETDR